ncbi:MAG: AAA family ATPase [Candidatus Omnitrophica bacterium]|nr:AAA family ATPase [Candidatus Omnitrophota bacterium]
MYEQFYHLKEKPFNNNPDPKFFYPSPKHQEALDRLLYAINEHKGFVVITGEIGSGKTTVCRTLLGKLGDKKEIAMITNTHLNAKELLMSILEDLSVPYKPGTKIKLLSQLNDYLISKMEAGEDVILIIDEAQNLTPSVLEELRMLSNLETDTDKLIQIVLMGQPQLREKLKLKELEQLKQRVAVHYHLYPLTKEEMMGYVDHRLKTASCNGSMGHLFTPEALEIAYQFSKGIPRLVNYACDNALLSGFVYEKKTIDKVLMTEVVNESHLKLKEEEEVLQTFCCVHCQHHNGCVTKWTRGQKGEEQICCEACAKYDACH